MNSFNVQLDFFNALHCNETLLQNFAAQVGKIQKSVSANFV